MTKKIMIDDLCINASIAGRGYPVLLLHGYLESLEIWGNFAKKLAKKFRIISIDLPGFGSSDSFGETHTMEIFADVVIRVLHKLGIQEFFLVGHSLGGYVSLAILDNYSNLLSGLCLFHSHPFPDSEQTITKRKREISLVLEGKQELIFNINIPNAFADINLDRMEDFICKARQIAAGTRPEGIVAALRGMIERPSRERILAETSIPVLLILGKEDNYIPFEEAGKKIRLPKNGERLILEKSGHMGFMEEPEVSYPAICSFIENCIRPAQAGRT